MFKFCNKCSSPICLYLLMRLLFLDSFCSEKTIRPQPDSCIYFSDPEPLLSEFNIYSFRINPAGSLAFFCRTDNCPGFSYFNLYVRAIVPW